MRNAECTEITADGEMRITLPRAIMRAAGIEPGMPLVAYEEDGQIVVEMRPAAWHGGSVDEELFGKRLVAGERA
ncbi:AbrB/MazE/SpoVT family DNA-binding domain-containing protein [Saccharopolyspora hirsuta]|uniref:AbrB/MazE/SpoVT family DNA-binding domain-containing protein n=1 Tax=Saccharopolyspora hirsuta TaxID=1837 RepID=A0A5M7BRY4_SACHI|nr:AbrB/MazE/SpoVT family DNA-binding domain-containing protein [Saccharopolyspora hirsuta]KAA5832542.1 AbrB/MazE/SpoVT family DNA-binding domain-containing protein [Saccharopolyspora hirsuta]